MLNRHNSSGGEAASIPDPVDFIDDGNFGIAGQQEVSVERMRWPIRNRVHRAAGRNQRLANHLAAKHALPPDLRRTPAKQIYLDGLEIKDSEQILYGGGHKSSHQIECGPRMRLAGLLGRSARVTSWTGSKSIGRWLLPSAGAKVGMTGDVLPRGRWAGQCPQATFQMP